MGLAASRGNVVLLTGASRGIGREMALQLAADGARPALAARDESTPAEVASACRDLVAETIDRLGRLDTLVVNAGISMWALFEEIEDFSIFEKIMR